MNKVVSDDGGNELAATKLTDPFQAYLPVVNQQAFLVALESVVASLADDLETVCEILGIPRESFPDGSDPLRFQKLLDGIFGRFSAETGPKQGC